MSSQRRSVVVILAWPDSDLLLSVGVAKRTAMTVGYMCYGIYTVSRAMVHCSR